jgi:hypothetical protein
MPTTIDRECIELRVAEQLHRQTRAELRARCSATTLVAVRGLTRLVFDVAAGLSVLARERVEAGDAALVAIAIALLQTLRLALYFGQTAGQTAPLQLTGSVAGRWARVFVQERIRHTQRLAVFVALARAEARPLVEVE